MAAEWNSSVVFKLVLIALTQFLLPVTVPSEAEPLDSAATAEAARNFAPKTSFRGSCSADSGRCKVTRFRRGKTQFRLAKAPRVLKIVPPKRSGRSAYELVFDTGPVADCSAEVTCPDGSVASCSAAGVNAQCTSNATSVGCLTVDSNGEGTGGSSSSCG